MIKLKFPNYSYTQSIDVCQEGITGNPDLLNKIINNKTQLSEVEIIYSTSASTGELYNINPLLHNKEDDPAVIGNLKKSDLLSLYNNYFSKQNKPARSIYDSIMIAADEKCPYCGGIGRPRNLDHYLPKAFYPQFSVLPINLIPSCRDCNMDGKGSDYFKIKDEQVLQPYLDSKTFFEIQWIFAKYIKSKDNNEPGMIDFFTNPPNEWSAENKSRVNNHFKQFDLRLRYSKEAAPRLVTYLSQIKRLTEVGLSLIMAKETILKPVIESSPFVNHWERVMCLTLINEL